MRIGGTAERVSLALQAGGASTRMGTDKALAQFVDGPLLQWIVRRVAAPFTESFVVANDPARFRHLGLPVVTDALSERGSLVGVYTALLASPTEKVLCLACDMPLVTPRLLRRLVRLSEGHEVAVPQQGDWFQPLCAVYGVGVLPEIERMLDAGERRIDRLYERVDAAYLDVVDGEFGDPDLLFLNVNTPEELERARGYALDARRAGLDLAAPGSSVLAPDIERFLADAPFPVVSFVGKKKSGKTSVLLGVIGELVRRGLRLAVIKHDAHGFDIDVPGTDSYRIREAGAAVTGISSPETYVWINDSTPEPSLAELLARIVEPVDLVITEGFKRQPAPKVEVSRRERSTELICRPEELVGIVSDQAFPDYPVPLLAMDDFVGIADLVVARILP
jgi:molybdopterin-guanine dinucleotide biosynthesis protein